MSGLGDPGRGGEAWQRPRSWAGRGARPARGLPEERCPEVGRASGPGRGRAGLQPTQPIQSHEERVVWINMQVLPGFLCGWADSRTCYSLHP